MRSTVLIGLALLVGCGPSEGPALVIGPAGANTFDDIYVEIDDDNADKYTYQWSVDGQELEDQTAATVSADLTRKGEEWSVTVSRGGASSTKTIEIGNALPSAEVGIEPGNPTASDQIIARGFATDPDGDAAFVTYEWQVSKDGGETFTASTFKSTTLPAFATERGDVWRVLVTPDDGDDRGAVGFLDFTIQNAVPLVTRLQLNRLDATTDQTLSVVAEATDPDDDPVSLQYQWVINGVDVPDPEGSSQVLDGALETGFDSGDEVYVKVRGIDSEDGPWRTSPTVLVKNGAPTDPEAAVEPAEPLADEPLRCVVAVAATDSDPGDTITYRAEWLVDGAPFIGGTRTSFEGDTISPDDTLPGEVWTCHLFASDPLGNESMGAAVASVGARSGCLDETSEVSWNPDTVGCASAEPITWSEASTNVGDYCAAGWEMAGADVVNTILNGPGYTDDWEFAFNGEGCGDVDHYATTNDSRNRSDRSCVWRSSHHTRLSSEDSEVDGVMCVRSEPAP